MPFEGEQEKVYEEEFQQLAKEVKWTSPLHILFDPNNIMIIHFTLLLKLHNLTGIPIKDLPSLLHMKP